MKITADFFNKTRIMGIVNTDSDSFSGDGLGGDVELAVEQCQRLAKEGAEIIDIGGESTRPGSEPISEEEELERVLPVIEKARKLLPEIIISVDTYKAAVAKKSIEAGANIVNDISSLRFDDEMGLVLKEHPDIYLILMHMQGVPNNMQDNPQYDDVVEDIIDFFKERIAYCQLMGIDKKRIMIDPGIGFGKTFTHNVDIIRRLAEFHTLKTPIVLGASRKRFIGEIYHSQPKDRLAGTLATTSFALQNRVNIVRVHDVQPNREFIDTYYAIQGI